MKQYLMYTCNISLDDEPDMYNKPQQASLSQAPEILDGFLKNQLNLHYRKNQDETQQLESTLQKSVNGIFLFMLQRKVRVPYKEGREKRSFDSNPGCYVIVDNRKDVRQLAIEKDSHFVDKKIAEAISAALNQQLRTVGLKVVIKPQKDPDDFWNTVERCVTIDDDPIQSVKLDFRDPRKSLVNGGNKNLLRRLLSVDFYDMFSNSRKLQMSWGGDGERPLMDKDNADALKNLSEIATLCALNDFDISLQFKSRRKLTMDKKVRCLDCMIDEKDIEEFRKGDTTIGSSGQLTALEVTLDEHLRTHKFVSHETAAAE